MNISHFGGVGSLLVLRLPLIDIAHLEMVAIDIDRLEMVATAYCMRMHYMDINFSICFIDNTKNLICH